MEVAPGIAEVKTMLATHKAIHERSSLVQGECVAGTSSGSKDIGAEHILRLVELHADSRTMPVDVPRVISMLTA